MGRKYCVGCAGLSRKHDVVEAIDGADLEALVIALFADDKPRHAAIRTAARRLVENGSTNPQIKLLAEGLEW